jgi:hypothetical protein
VRRRGLSAAEALAISGGLSAPGKMPGYAYSLPAESCRLGTTLRHLPRSVCARCYALRGRYRFLRVARALARRLRAISHPRWVEAVSALIARSGERYFRWHDSGDLQDVWHLRKIIAVCLRCPDVKFWLPTREYQTVEAYLRRGGRIPANLCIRYSAHLVDGPPPLRYGLPVSTVSSSAEAAPAGAHRCRASLAGNCGTCRACWDPSVRIVDFPLQWGSPRLATGGSGSLII